MIEQNALPKPLDYPENEKNDANLTMPSVDGDTLEEKSHLLQSSNEKHDNLNDSNNIPRISDLEKIDDMEKTKSSKKQGTNMFGSGKYADCIRPFVGLLLSAFGACVMAIAAVMVKRLKSTSVFVILIIRFTVMILMAIPILYFR